MQLQVTRQQQLPEGLYRFYEGEMNYRTVTIRMYGNKVGAAELFNGRKLIGENVLRRFDRPGITFDEVVQEIANLFETDVDVMKPNPQLNSHNCYISREIDRTVKHVVH